MKSIVKFYLIITLIATSFILSSCNTIQGAGTDIKKGGQAIERAAGG